MRIFTDGDSIVLRSTPPAFIGGCRERIGETALRFAFAAVADQVAGLGIRIGGQGD